MIGAVGVVISGLAGGAVRAEGAMPYVGVSSASVHYAQSGLAGAYEAFFGRSYQDIPKDDRPDFGGLGGGGGAGGGGSPTRTEQLLGLVVGVRHNIHEGRKLRLVRDLRVSLERHRYFLPQGFGVFRDPTTIRFSAVSLAAEMEISPADPRGFRPVLALGGVASRVTTRIDSALLAIRDRGWQNAVYGRVGAEYAPREWRCAECRFVLDVRAYSTGAAEVSAGFFRGF